MEGNVLLILISIVILILVFLVYVAANHDDQGSGEKSRGSLVCK